MRRTRPSERGQTLIEGALALLVFFSLLFGVIDCGLVLVRHQSLVERVRSAVRWGVVRPWDGSGEQIANLILYDQPDGTQRRYWQLSGADARERAGALSTRLAGASRRRNAERFHRQLPLSVPFALDHADLHKPAPGLDLRSHGVQSRCSVRSRSRQVHKLSCLLALVKPFQPYRYSAQAGDPATLLTQPYDKISPQMQARYLAASPYNLVRVILGEKRDSDTAADNVYTRSARYFEDWIRQGILAQDPAPGFYPYFQDFAVPDSGERLTRKGFIGLGKLEDYGAGVVYRHEETLVGPKKDRLEVLRHTRAHFGQTLHAVSGSRRIGGSRAGSGHARRTAGGRDRRVWRAPPLVGRDRCGSQCARIQELMAPMKLLIADGHHRYETALTYRDEHPDDPAAQYVMMTFVNMYSPGVKILATHRVLRNLADFTVESLLSKATGAWSAKTFDSLDELKRELNAPAPQTVRIGAVTATGALLLTRPRKDGELDVPVLHQEILGKWLGISEDAVREEKYIHYVRGIDAAVAEVRERGAQVAFLLEPTPIDDMARVAFAGGVMPQKATDFYPKLLTGVAIYRL